VGFWEYILILHSAFFSTDIINSLIYIHIYGYRRASTPLHQTLLSIGIHFSSFAVSETPPIDLSVQSTRNQRLNTTQTTPLSPQYAFPDPKPRLLPHRRALPHRTPPLRPQSRNHGPAPRPLGCLCHTPHPHQQIVRPPPPYPPLFFSIPMYLEMLTFLPVSSVFPMAALILGWPLAAGAFLNKVGL